MRRQLRNWQNQTGKRVQAGIGSSMNLIWSYVERSLCVTEIQGPLQVQYRKNRQTQTFSVLYYLSDEVTSKR